MLRQWPNLKEGDILIVRYSKASSFLNVIVTGMFFLFGLLMLLFAIRGFSDRRLDMSNTFHIIGTIILTIFVIVVGYFTISNLRNIIGTPNIRLVANSEGLFLDITMDKNQAFFIPWSDIETFQIRRISDPFWSQGGWKTKSDTLSIVFKKSANIKLPRIVKNVALANSNEIDLNSYTLDISLEEAVSKLSKMKQRYS